MKLSISSLTFGILSICISFSILNIIKTSNSISGTKKAKEMSFACSCAFSFYFANATFFSIVWLHCSKVAKASTHRHSLEARDSVLLPFWPGRAPAPRGAAVDIRRTEIGERSSSSSFSSPTEATSKAQSWQEILQRPLSPLTSHEPPKT